VRITIGWWWTRVRTDILVANAALNYVAWLIKRWLFQNSVVRPGSRPGRGNRLKSGPINRRPHDPVFIRLDKTPERDGQTDLSVFSGGGDTNTNPCPPGNSLPTAISRKKSHIFLLKHKKKPFEPDALPRRRINQNCSCCWGCAADPPHWKSSLERSSFATAGLEDGSAL